MKKSNLVRIGLWVAAMSFATTTTFAAEKTNSWEPGWAVGASAGIGLPLSGYTGYSLGLAEGVEGSYFLDSQIELALVFMTRTYAGAGLSSYASSVYAGGRYYVTDALGLTLLLGLNLSGITAGAVTTIFGLSPGAVYYFRLGEHTYLGPDVRLNMIFSSPLAMNLDLTANFKWKF